MFAYAMLIVYLWLPALLDSFVDPSVQSLLPEPTNNPPITHCFRSSLIPGATAGEICSVRAEANAGNVSACTCGLSFPRFCGRMTDPSSCRSTVRICSLPDEHPYDLYLRAVAPGLTCAILLLAPLWLYLNWFYGRIVVSDLELHSTNGRQGRGGEGVPLGKIIDAGVTWHLPALLKGHNASTRRGGGVGNGNPDDAAANTSERERLGEAAGNANGEGDSESPAAEGQP